MVLYHVNVGFPVAHDGVGGAGARAIRRGARRASGRGLHDARRAGVRVRRAGVRARERRRAGRHRARRSREPAARHRRVRGVPAGSAPAPLHVADARRGHLRRRDRAVHEPHGRPPRRPRARRADRARPGREAQLRPRARGARRRGRDRAVRGAGRSARREPRSRRQDVRRLRREQGRSGAASPRRSWPKARASCSSHATRPPPQPSSAARRSRAPPISRRSRGSMA